LATERPRVLIVDDQPRNLDALEAMLAPIECTVVRANTPDEALLSLLRHDFAAIVLDIRMPQMSGIDLAKLIKQRKRSQHVPIVFLTAHTADEHEVLKGYDVGAVDYLSKPINPDILRSKVGVFIDAFSKTLALANLNFALEREIVERQQAERALQQANDELERRVQERTAALTRAHQGVRENEERLRMALQVAQIAAWEWDLLTGRMQWSTDPEKLFGFPSGAFGHELRMVRAVHPDDRARVEAAEAAALETGVYEAEYRVVRGDRSIVWITERGKLVDRADAPRMVGITRDVTAEREYARERERLLRSEQQARDDAERQGRLKDEFLATLSHELRTPMNAILGWLAILQSGKPIRDLSSSLAVIGRNAQLQAKLIEDLLDMNRLMTGHVQLDLGPVEVASLIQATKQALQPTADAKGVQLVATVSAVLPATVADGRRLQQVLWNVVHNAIKFTPKQGRVEIQAEQRAHEIHITVRDTGTGIDPAFLPHVFERFRQQDASATRSTSGLGLGLSIAKQLVELHGGTITALSAGEGAGSVFEIAFPVQPELQTPATPPTLGSNALVS
jgi:PAS domain S-box-containing protein